MRLVDADVLLNGLDSICVEKMNSKNPCPLVCTLCPLSDMLDVIENAPTVDAESVRHGYWIENDNGTYSCSECHSWIPNEQHYYARYCLYCGARMDIKYGND